MSSLIPGSQTVFYATKETVYGTARKIKGLYAMRTLTERFTPQEEREPRGDRTSTPDHEEMVVGRHSADWEITKLILPNGNTGIVPDDTDLWEALFGHVSAGATSVEYLQATAHVTSLTLRKGVRGAGADASEFQEHVEGAICNRGEIAWGSQGNNNQAQVTFAGMGQRWGFTGNTTLSADKATNASHTTTSVTVANSLQLTPGSIICIRKSSGVLDTGGGSGILVTSINWTNHMVYFGDTLDTTHTNADFIRPYNPTGIFAGSPLHAKRGTLSLDGNATQVKHLGGRVTFEDNRSLLNDEVGQDEPTEVLRAGKRNVTFTYEVQLKKTEVGLLLGGMFGNTGHNIQIVLGHETGGRFEIDLRKARYDMTAPEIAEEMARVTMTGRAYGVNGNDSLKVRYK